MWDVGVGEHERCELLLWVVFLGLFDGFGPDEVCVFFAVPVEVGFDWVV